MSALDGVSMMIGGGVNRKYEPAALEKAAQTSSGSSFELSGSALSQAAAPLLAPTAAFLSFSGNACDSPEPNSAIARGCAAQEEAARTGERPENDLAKYSRQL